MPPRTGESFREHTALTEHAGYRSCLVLTPRVRLRWCLRSRRQSLLLHGFFGGCKGTTFFRPLAAGVGSVLPSGADVSADSTVVTTYPDHLENWILDTLRE